MGLEDLGSFSYVEDLSFFFWLCGIARTIVLSYLRRLRRTLPPLGELGRPWQERLEADDVLSCIAGRDPGPLREACEGDQLFLIALALGALPERRREAVMLKYIERLSADASAEKLSLAPGQFRELTSRALLQLRDTLVELLGDEA